MRLWSYFSGSFDVLMNELLFQFFELPRHKALILSLLALFVRRPLFLDQRSKHRKITETLLLEKVRVLKKSSLVVFFKHGSNPSDSLLELNVVKNNKTTVLGHLLFNFLFKADEKMIWAISCLLRALLLYREDSIFDNIYKNLEGLIEELRSDFEKLFAGNLEMPENIPVESLHIFSLLLLDLLRDSGFKEFIVEHFILEKLVEILLMILNFIKEEPTDDKVLLNNLLDLSCLIGKVLGVGLNSFEGFDFPNSKVPKKFNGDHLLLRKTSLVTSCRQSIVLVLNLLKAKKIKKVEKYLPWMSLLQALSGTQTGRFFVVFGQSNSVVSKEKSFAAKRNSSINLKEIVDQMKNEPFTKIKMKFNSCFKYANQSINNALNKGLAHLSLEKIQFLFEMGKFIINLLFGDDNEIKGLSALRVYFIEKTFFKKATLWEVVKNLLNNFTLLQDRLNKNSEFIENNKNQEFINKIKNIKKLFLQLSRFLENYYPLNSKDSGIKKMFKKKSKWQSHKNGRDYGRREDEKFKLRMQKHNQIYQRIYSGKLNYDDDNIVPFLSDLEFFQQNNRTMIKAAQVLGI